HGDENEALHGRNDGAAYGLSHFECRNLAKLAARPAAEARRGDPLERGFEVKSGLVVESDGRARDTSGVAYSPRSVRRWPRVSRDDAVPNCGSIGGMYVIIG